MRIRFATRVLLGTTLLLGLFGLPNESRADAPLEDRKAAAADELRSNPDDPEAWLFQADLHREEGKFDEAIGAYQNAARVGANQDGVDTTIAVILADAGMPRASAATLDRVLARSPDYRGARIVRARQRAAQGDPRGAAVDFKKALDGTSSVRPGLVLEGMEILVLAGQREDALGIADARMSERGALVALQLPAIEIELSLGNHEGALRRLDTLLVRHPDHPAWLQRRGEILLAAGRTDEARQSFSKGLAAVEARQSKRKSQRLAMIERELRAQLARQTETDGGTSE